jgi:hypothetical protein
MKDEQIFLGAMRQETPLDTGLAEGTRPNIEREQFSEAIADSVCDVADLIQDSYTERERKALLGFLEYFSDQPDGCLEILITPDHGVVLAFVG